MRSVYVLLCNGTPVFQYGNYEAVKRVQKRLETARPQTKFEIKKKKEVKENGNQS